MLLNIILSFLTALVFWGSLYFLVKKRQIRFSFIDFLPLVIITVCMSPVILYFLEYFLYSQGISIANHRITWVALVILSLLMNGFSFLFLDRDLHIVQSKTAKTVFSRLTVIASVLFVFELFIGNYSCFSPAIHHLKKTTLDYTQAGTVTKANPTENGLPLPAGQVASVTFSDIDLESRCILLNMKNDTSFSNITVKITDDNFSKTSYMVYSGACNSTYKNSMILDVCSSGKLKSLTLEFNADSPNYLQSVTINQPKDFAFHILRYFLLTLLIASVYLIVKLKLWKVVYDRKNIKHCALVVAACILCVAMSLSIFGFFIKSKDKDKDRVAFTDYPLQNSIATYSPYTQQMDAFIKGQVYLDIPVDDKLAALVNPYDTTLRQNVAYSWDRALYNGHYYSYYGVAPIVTVYYPLYLLTHKVAQDWLVCNIFSVLLTVSILFLVLQLVKWYVRSPNLLLLLLGIFSTVLVSMPLILQITSSFYCVPVLSALLNMTLFLNFALKGYKNQKFYYFILSAAAFALMVASRPDYVLTGLIAVPLFFSILASKDIPFKNKAVDACSFIVPVLIGGGLIMRYNDIRFGSVFQFGAVYQLTVSDAGYNTAGVYSIFPAVFHYFLQPMNVSSQFPFLSPGSGNLGSYAHYAYITASIGVLAYPAVLPILATPFGIQRRSEHKEALIQNVTLLFILLTAVAMAFAVYTFGGAIRQYTADFLLLFALAAFLVLMLTESRAQDRQDDFAQKLVVYIGALLLFVTIIQCIFLTFNCESFRLKTLAGKFYYYVADMFMF